MQGDLALTIDPRRLTRSGILELMRVAAGLSYKDLSRLTAIPRARVIRLVRGAYPKAQHRYLDAIREVCWARLPARMPALAGVIAPPFLTLEEAAELMAVSPTEMRRLAVRCPALRAIKVGRKTRIPAAALSEFLTSPTPRGKGNGVSLQEASAILRVHVCSLRKAIRAGRLQVEQQRKHYPIRISPREFQRLLRQGTHELRPWRSDLSRGQRS